MKGCGCMINYPRIQWNKALSRLLVVLLLISTFFLSACNSSANTQIQEELDTLKAKYETLLSDYNKLLTDSTVLQEKIKDAEPWFQLSELEKEAERDRLAAEEAAKAEVERLTLEKEAAEAEAKEKEGYNTGITYNQLSRTPDTYKNEKVKFYGKVLQVIEANDETQLRIATNGSYDDVILVVYSSSIVSSRVLVDDYITIYGYSMGLHTYKSTLGGDITIPLILVVKIDQ